MAKWAWWQLVLGALRRLFRGKSATLDGIGEAGADAGLWPERGQGPDFKGQDITQSGPGSKAH